MIPLGSTAFRDDLTPFTLQQSAVQVESIQPELAEEMHEFAADFAAIRNLPEQKLS